MTENTITTRRFEFVAVDNQIYTLDEYMRLIAKQYMEEKMDKKMRKVTKKIRTAESTLKKAEKENTKLANYDEKVRDPKIEKCDKMMKKKK